MKELALTFDDGPNPPYTNQILDILKKEKIKAVFFVCGANIKRHPEVVKKIATDGHLIGNHTYYHHYLPTILGLTYNEIIETQQLIDSLVSQKEKLFRAPWGINPPWLEKKLKQRGFKLVPVGVMGNDWQRKISAQKVTELILSRAKDGSIITLHDGAETQQKADRSKTVEALPKIIEKLQKNNFEFILLADSVTD